MAEQGVKTQLVHRWYTRPVLFVADVNRAAYFYVNVLGFEMGWHEGDGAGTVCQVNHGECEIILCEDAARGAKGRLFELSRNGLADLRREFVERSARTKETWWGSNALQVDDPDGNELLFPFQSEQLSRKNSSASLRRAVSTIRPLVPTARTSDRQLLGSFPDDTVDVETFGINAADV